MPICPACGYRTAMRFTVKSEDGAETAVVPCINCEKKAKED